MAFDQIGFGKRLKEARRSAGFTQQELAEKIHIEQKHISKMENGTRCCSIDLLIDLSEMLNVSTDYLLKGSASASDHKQQLRDVIEQLVELSKKL